MSKDIVCVRAAPAEPSLESTLLLYNDVCRNLLERTRKKLNTQNPQLISCIRKAIRNLEHCNSEASNNHCFYCHRLSTTSVDILKAGVVQLLDATRRLEGLIRPFEQDWIIPPWDVQLQCDAACNILLIVAGDMYLIRQIARLARTRQRSDPSRSLQNSILIFEQLS